MLKALRKYNKWILGIGGSLLMVTFLLTGPASIFQPDPLKRVVARIGDDSIRTKEMLLADREYNALKSFVPFLVTADFNIESGAHWLLISHEAERAGLVGKAGDGPDWIPDLAQREMILRMLTQFRDRNLVMQLLSQPGMLEQQSDMMRQQLDMARPMVANSSQLMDTEFDMALSKLRGVSRLVTAYTNAARLSDRHAIIELKRLLDQVQVDGIVIPADRIADDMPEPTEDEVKAHLDKYRSVKPGEGEFGFGYVQPPRIKFEWLKLDKAMIAGAINLDPIEVNKHWQQNRATYAKEFAEEKARIETDLRNQKVDEALLEADRAVKARIRSVTRKLETEAGIKKLPADWDAERPTMESTALGLIDAVKSATGITMPLPKVEVRGSEWIKISDLNDDVPEVGTATFRIGSKTGTLAMLMADVFELNPKTSLGLQSRVPFELPLTDPQGNVYYVCVLDVRAESPPETLDEVRAQVVKDLRRLAAFEKLRSEQSTYQLLAASDGLDAVARLFDKPALPDGKTVAPPLEVFRAVPVSRERGDPVQPVLNSEILRNDVMTLADALGPLTKATPENAAARTLAAAVPSELALAVVQIVSQDPLVREDLRMVSTQNLDSLQRDELVKATGDRWPFAFEALKKRMNYKTVGDDDTQAPAAPATTTSQTP